MEPLLFIILALILGTATRHFLKRSPIPYTVLLMIFGLILGFITRRAQFSGMMLELAKSIDWAGHINPHVILFVFLPTLIFEASFGMNVHTIKKTAKNSILLAIPGILISMLLTGCFAIGIRNSGIGLIRWDWNLAFLFGALISATDPVAVVALLKEMGVSKKISTLIDGEAILNDGTAIVLFMVFLALVTGETAGSSPVAEFFRVSLGGMSLGILIAIILIAWLRNVFNDAMVEISIIVAAAYITFFIAEHFLHVSGVIALFGLGLTMAAYGTTRISPEVEGFMNEFWELASYIANTCL